MDRTVLAMRRSLHIAAALVAAGVMVCGVGPVGSMGTGAGEKAPRVVTEFGVFNLSGMDELSSDAHHRDLDAAMLAKKKPAKKKPGKKKPGRKVVASAPPSACNEVYCAGVDDQPPAGSAADFVFSSTAPDGSPARFDPCRPLRWMVDGTSAEVVLAREAMRRLAVATGLSPQEVAYDGYRPFVSTEPGLDTGKEMVLTFTTADEVAQLAGDVAGLTGSSYVLSGNSARRFFAELAIDRASFDGDASSDVRLVLRILMHELGHAAGLGHTEGQVEVMYFMQSHGDRPMYEAGDLAGLARLGSAAGCQQ